MNDEREKKYQETIERMSDKIHEAYLFGRQDALREHRALLIPETMELTIRVRDKNDELETIRQVLTFDQIKQGRTSIVRLLIEEIFLKLAAAKIIRNLIESTK